MNETTISLRLELRVDGDTLSGAAIEADGTRREFLGRLGLISAIDAVVAGAGGDARPTPDRQEAR